MRVLYIDLGLPRLERVSRCGYRHTARVQFIPDKIARPTNSRAGIGLS